MNFGAVEIVLATVVLGIAITLFANSRHSSAFQIILFLVFVPAIFLAWYTYPRWFPWPAADPQQQIAVRGQYGDSFGALNTLFTGLAFAAVFVTLSVQLLEATRRELEATRRERDRHEDYSDSRFFRMMDAWRSLTESIRYDASPVTGKSVLVEIYRNIQKDFEHARGEKKSEIEALASEAYERHYGHHEHVLGPYFRLLYLIIRHVEASVLRNKEDYIRLVLAELSQVEVVLLGLHGIPRPDFKRLVEDFHLLENLPASAPGRGWFKDVYSRSAFSNSP